MSSFLVMHHSGYDGLLCYLTATRSWFCSPVGFPAACARPFNDAGLDPAQETVQVKQCSAHFSAPV